jgi:heme o synthase
MAVVRPMRAVVDEGSSSIGMRDDPVTNPVPGPWLRATAVLAWGATGIAMLNQAVRPNLDHRVSTLAALAALGALSLQAWCADHRRVLPPALTALGLTILEAFIGTVLAGSRVAWDVDLHVVMGALAFAATTVAAWQAFRGRSAGSESWRDYVLLTKPRIMVLLLLTAAGGVFAAARGHPSPAVLAAVLAGGALASGGASAINHVMDRDIDRLMTRTDRRPVAAERISASRALEFGLALTGFSFVLLVTLVNALAAFLALLGSLLYVLVYTAWLKRTTPQNIVIGGAAGTIPPLVGWAAATGKLSIPAMFLFLIVFLWTPPHFWSLALLIKRQYAAARVPMLPVVRGERAATRGILVYSVLLVCASALPFLWGGMGLAYLVPAAALGCGFVALALRLRISATPERARALFHYSLLYLAAMFVALSLAPLV